MDTFGAPTALVPLLAVALGLALFALAWQTRRASKALAAERHLRRLVDESPHLVAILGRDAAILHINATGLLWLQGNARPLTGQRLDAVPGLELGGDGPAALAAALAQARAQGLATLELEFNRRHLGPLRLDLTLRPLPAARDTGAPRLLAEARDITLARNSEDKLQLAAAVFEQAREGFVIADGTGQVISVNQAFCEISGYTAEELQGHDASALVLAAGDDPAMQRQLLDALQLHGHWQGEVRSARKDGRHYTCWASLTCQRDARGRATHYIGIVNDITQFREAEQRLVRLTHLDSLTGLPNRSLLADRVGQLTSVSRRDHRPFALMFMDLDQFKHINDTLGHSIGDALLAEMGRRLQASLRDGDTVARLGGDEFAVLLPGSDAEGASQVAAKLLEGMAQPCSVLDHELSLTMSIGISVYPADGDDFEMLSRNADTAMYRAKHEGRATWRFFTAGMQQRSARHLQLDAALRRALERDELLLHYQPQLSGDGRTVVGVEALLRWKHPELGMISPGEFIPLAENSGQIVTIGEWVLRTAVTQLKAWIDAGLPPMVIAVNLSAVQFRHSGLLEMVRRALADAGLAPQWLELELTESVATGQPQAAVAIMDALHALGVRLSIDDFGTGYSSLSYLKRFPIHTLKIDQSFVRDIDTDPDDRAIVQAIIQMARSLKLKTLAEGVETDAQHAFLRSEGCDMVQGYRFCRPLAAAAIPPWIATHAVAQTTSEATG